MKNDISSLQSKYPEFFREHRTIECSNGWYHIVKDALKSFRHRKINININQIKEKFGGLRIYFDISEEEFAVDRALMHNEAEQIVREAEMKSMKTCKICGKAGKTININGWYRTLCFMHHFIHRIR
jgi:predicted transposase YbfD/YdcC